MTKSVLLISPDVIGEKMAGPGIRYINMAIELSRYFNVVLLIPNVINKDYSPIKISVIERKTLKRELAQADVVIIQGTILARFPEIKKTKIPIVIDLYDPFILENLESRKNDSMKETLFQYDLRILIDQLKNGDYFICSNDRQLDFWVGMLTATGRVNPTTYENSPTLDRLISKVPFGIINSPYFVKKSIKDSYPGLNKNDYLFIWGGGIWDWLDPETAIRAIYRISKIRKDVKLMFMGIIHPDRKSEVSNIIVQSVQLAKDLGVYQTQVLFNDWIDYDDRYQYLIDANAGLSIHKLHIETKYSFRTRVLDYIWASIPIITTTGDAMADFVEKFKVGWVISPGDDFELSQAILSSIRDEDFVLKINERLQELKRNFYWEKSVEPLVGFCSHPILSPDHRHKKNSYRLKSYILFKLSSHKTIRSLLRYFRRPIIIKK